MNSIWPQVLAIYKMFGRDAAKRMLTPPRKFVEAACTKTGADVEKALNERAEMVEEALEFLESLTDTDFEDPETFLD